MTIKVSHEQRAAIGRAILNALGTTPEEHRINPASIVGVHSGPSGTLVIVSAVPFSWCPRQGGNNAKAPIEQVRRKETP
jgi:hypothetical protein